MQKHLLKLLDLSQDEIIEILDTASDLKDKQKKGEAHTYLQGKTVALIFMKNSTRTRASFETGIYQLGGHGLYLSSSDTQIGRGEPIEDTARVLSRYCDAIMIRTFAQEDIETLAKYASIPIINGLTDSFHPCQVLADLLTIREYKGKLSGLNVCYIGDGNNMANSIIVGALKCGMNVSIATPTGYEPDAEVLAFADTVNDASFTLTTDPMEAAHKADVLFTDVWASMGQEEEAEARRIAFRGFQINDDLLAVANPDAIVQHCLPAHRGEEITAEVFDAHADEIFDEAENRLHVQKAIMYLLMK